MSCVRLLSLSPYLRLAVFLQPGDNAGGEGVETGHTDGGVEGLEELISYALKLQTFF